MRQATVLNQSDGHRLKRLVALLVALVRPSVLGGAYLFGLAALDLDPPLERFMTLFGPFAWLAGMAFGVAAALLVGLRDRMLDTAPCPPRRFVTRAFAAVVVAHGLLWLHDVALRPQLHQAGLYAKGGARRTLQVAVTDTLGTNGVAALALLALFAFLAGPPSRWSEWPPRIERAIACAVRSRAPWLATAFVAAALVLYRLFSIGVAPTASPDGRMNVLLITVDSLRFDRLAERTAPRFSALARSSTNFERAYVSLPRALPSWATLLTGRDPHHHGIRSTFPRYADRAQDLAAIPHRFAEAGYRTIAVGDRAGNDLRRIDFGFQTIGAPAFDSSEGFGRSTHPAPSALLPLLRGGLVRHALPIVRDVSNVADAERVTDDAIDAVDSTSGAPFFLTVSYSAPHAPYAARAPHFRRFTRAAYRGRFKYDASALLDREPLPDEADIAQIRGLYDGAVASVDAAAGRLLDALTHRNLLDRTIVVVTAPYGETLFESGRGQGHGDHLFGDEGTHVPLIVHDPRNVTPRAVTTLVRDVDLAPTLCDLTGVEAPHGLDGRSLTPALEGKALSPALAYAETGLWPTGTLPSVPTAMRLPYPDLPQLIRVAPEHDDAREIRAEHEAAAITAKHRMVRDERHKLVYVPTRSGVKWLLYDTVVDPDESRDVSADLPDVTTRLRDALFRWMLEDRRMERRDGYLVARTDAWGRDVEPVEPSSSPDRAVALRLVDRLRDAAYISPRLEDAFPLLRGQPQRMKAPYVGPVGMLGKTVRQVALTMSDEHFAQRESVLAPAPTTIRYRIAIPHGATLETAVALAVPSAAPVTFDITVSDAREGRRLLASHEIAAYEAPRWNELSTDLSKYGGRTLDLELATRSPPGSAVTHAALWGSPVVTAPGATAPFNIVWLVVDGLRSDAIAALHDDVRDGLVARAPIPPLGAWLPKMPGVAPNLDALAERAVAFTRAWSAGTWTRPGTVAMLTGMRSSELGLDTTALAPPRADLVRFYASSPPWLPILLRPYGFVTRAIVHNSFMNGFAPGGVDTGFEAVDAHSAATHDADAMTNGALAWLERHRDERFALFCNFRLPHPSYHPSSELIDHISALPDVPKSPRVRAYLASVAEHDAAIGRIVAKLDELRLRDRTIVVVTAGRAETLSTAHDGTVLDIDAPSPSRLSPRANANANWDESARIPLLVSLPGTLPQGVKVGASVQTTDIVPTLLELERITRDPRITGRSLVPMAFDPNGTEARREVPIVVEGRGTRSVSDGRWRYVERDPIAQRLAVAGRPVRWKDELYDLERDPGERENLATREPAVARAMRDELALAMVRAKTAAAAASDALAGSGHALEQPSVRPEIHLRFAGAGVARRVRGTIRSERGDGDIVPRLSAKAIGVAQDSLRRVDDGLEIALSTAPNGVVGLDLSVDPPTAHVTWQLYLDDEPFPSNHVYGGPFGLASSDLTTGIVTELARQVATASSAPMIDPARELGLFVTRDRVGDELDLDRATDD